VVAVGRGTTPATSAWFGPNLGPTHRARQHAATFSSRLHRARTLRRGRVTRSADLGVKGLPWSIDFGSLKIGSDLRFRNGADSHEAAAKESTYA
jgi:hypothetical protein